MLMNLSLGRCGRKLAWVVGVSRVVGGWLACGSFAARLRLVLGNGPQLRYPISVGDVSERPKVQHSKCCLV